MAWVRKERLDSMWLVLVLLLPFAGTTLGSACVFFQKAQTSPFVERLLKGFAAGVMVAASVWSLLIPAMDESQDMGQLAWVPAAVGFTLGILFLLLLDHIIPHLHSTGETEGLKVDLPNSVMLALAVILHNIPEGMAVGALCAGWISGAADISLSAALALSIGIAIQNFPEGAIVSMPLRSDGMGRGRSFLWGVFSGAVEPVAAVITVLLADLMIPVLPYLLGFAAGAMMYVVVEELIPETAGSSEEGHSNGGVLFFAAGFVLMMILDVALG